MRTRFVACSACARHVRAGDPECPFCGGSAPATKPLRVLRGRFSRAAMHAAGAAGALFAISDCTSTRGVAFYGAACVDDSCMATVEDAGEDASDGSASGNDANAMAFYGAPCVGASCAFGEDAGRDAPSDMPTDAHDEAGDVESADAPVDSNAGG